jgi:hypothetical protein
MGMYIIWGYNMILEGVEGSLNLKTLYNQCDKKYFGGAMPKCKVAWSGRLKRAIGRAQVRWRGPSVSKNNLFHLLPEIPQADVKIIMDSLSIAIASMNDLTKEDTTAILLHEMVHILLFSQRKLGGHHGTPEFDGWIKRLRKESGLNIPFKESSFKKSPKLKAKKGYIAIIYQRDGKIGLCNYTQKLVYDSKFEMQLDRFAKMYFKGIEVYYASHPIVNTIPSKRTFRSITWHNLEKSDADQIVREIKKNGKKIFSSN